MRETVPDSVLGSADDVVLIDITPQSLIERLRAGKIYPSERIEAALNNFFKLENLSALREVALRQVAEEVEHQAHPVRDGGTRARGPAGRHRRPAGDRRAAAGADHATTPVAADRSPRLALGPAPRG